MLEHIDIFPLEHKLRIYSEHCKIAGIKFMMHSSFNSLQMLLECFSICGRNKVAVYYISDNQYDADIEFLEIA